MPQGVKEREREQADSKGSQKKPALARSQQWLGLPDSVKRVFDRFPLKSYPANPLPQNILSTRDEHALYIFASSGDARSGRPSYNPGCLKWQTFLRFQGISFRCVSSSNHASPTGALPFLLPAQSGGDLSTPVVSQRILGWIRKRQDRGEKRHRETSLDGPENGISGDSTMEQKEQDDMRYEAYLSLLDHRVRNAYLYALYLSPLNFESVAYPLYIEPTTSNSLVHLYLSRQLRSLSVTELLKQSSVIDAESLYYESERAFSALSTLLGEDDYFLHSEQPGLFDASIFAYTNILLDETLHWRERRMMEGLEKFENLVNHRKRILQNFYNGNQ